MKATALLGLPLFVCLAVACGAVDAPQVARGPQPDSGERTWPDDAAEDAPTTADASADDCGSLTRTACLTSKTCELTLTTTKGLYLCRAAEGRCEEDLAQADLTKGKSAAEADESKKVCTSRPGCAFQMNNCYCRCRGTGRTTVEDGTEADDCDCVCAGGTPSACVAAP